MLPAAQSQIAGERKRSRWDKARLSLVVPIGGIVAVAIVCVVIAVLTSAKRADEVSLNREQQLLQRSHCRQRPRTCCASSKAPPATPQATAQLRNNYDPQWVGSAHRQMAANLLPSRRRGDRRRPRSDRILAVPRAQRRRRRPDRSTCEPIRHEPRSAAWPAERRCRNGLRGHRQARSRQARSQHGADPAFPRPARDRRARSPSAPTAILRAGNARRRSCSPSGISTTHCCNEIGHRLQLTELRQIDDPALAGRRARHRTCRCARRRDRAFCLEADAAGRHHRRQRVAVHRGGARRLRAVGRSRCCATCGAPPRRSGPANCNCAISPCTIRSAACPTASISASGSKP